jgi:hypothetical protein
MVSLPSSARRAFQVIQKFTTVRDDWDRAHNQDLSFLDIGFGIVTDKVVLGAIGSGKVRDFTAIGPAVNLAASFEKQARNGKRVLVNQATWIAVQDIVKEMTGPVTFELRKPDQQVGIPYKMYHLVSLGDATEIAVSGTKRDASPRTLKVFLCHSSAARPAFSSRRPNWAVAGIT